MTPLTASQTSQQLAKKYLQQFLETLGVETDTEHLRDTPRRVVTMFKELLRGYKDPTFEFTTFAAPKPQNMVVQQGIKFYSLCAHHMLPFFGSCHIAYVPEERIVGLSKLSRTVHHFAARLQVQEELTQQILSYLNEKLKPQGCMVIMRAQHLCQEMRGARSVAATTTSALSGIFKEKSHVKAEFLQLLRTD